jgi:hypothetical protein
MGVPIGPSLYSLAAALFGLALAALALRRIAVQTRNLPSGHGHQNLADQTAPVSVRPIYKSVAIWLVVILFVAVGAFEVALRVGTRPAAAPGAPLPPLSNITVGTLNGDLDVAQFYSSGTEDSPQTFYFSYEGAGENMNIDMRIRTPEGSDVWTRHWEAGSISFNDPSESLKLTVPGQWRIEISGTAVNLKIKMNGAVR